MYAHSATSHARIKSNVQINVSQKATHLIHINASIKYIAQVFDTGIFNKVAWIGSKFVHHQATAINPMSSIGVNIA
jgi:hypothetical protein